MAKKQWLEQGGIFTYGQLPKVHNILPTAVYELKFNSFTNQFFLEFLFEKFEMPSRVYDLELPLIERVVKAFKHHKKNFGLLLKGLKGTGKTVAAKVICNELNLPVILITKPWTDMANFINSLDQDVILFFDEFEKIYSFYQFDRDDHDAESNEQSKVSNLLTLMDGVFTSKFKRLFLLTTNKEYLPDAMMARPSRVRYVKDFKDLSAETIRTILDDSVKNKELIPDLIDMIKQLEIITVDIVKAIAEEANLFNTADPEFFTIFNVKRIENNYELYTINKNGEEEIINANTRMFLNKGHHLYDEDHEYYGTIVKVDTEQDKLELRDVNNNKKKHWTIQYRKAKTVHYSYMM